MQHDIIPPHASFNVPEQTGTSGPIAGSSVWPAQYNTDTAGEGGVSVVKPIEYLLNKLSNQIPSPTPPAATEITFGAGGAGARRVLIEVGPSSNNKKTVNVTQGYHPGGVGINEYLSGPSATSRGEWATPSTSGHENASDQFSITYGPHASLHLVTVRRLHTGGGWTMGLRFYATAYPNPMDGEASDKKMIIKLQFDK